MLLTWWQWFTCSVVVASCGTSPPPSCSMLLPAPARRVVNKIHALRAHANTILILCRRVSCQVPLSTAAPDWQRSECAAAPAAGRRAGVRPRRPASAVSAPPPAPAPPPAASPSVSDAAAPAAGRRAKVRPRRPASAVAAPPPAPAPPPAASPSVSDDLAGADGDSDAPPGDGPDAVFLAALKKLVELPDACPKCGA